jgi:hypothetical protein
MDVCRAANRLSVFSAAAVLGALLPKSAGAQAPPVGDESGVGGLVAVAIVVVGLPVLLAVWVRLHDLRQRRELEAIHIQSRIADALFQDSRFGGAVVIPTVRVPRWPGSPLAVVMSGEVPDPELREAALRIAVAEAERIRPDARIEDRMMVLPTTRHVA